MKPELSDMEQVHTKCVSERFGRVAKRYELMNTLMTFGQEKCWRQFVVERADLQAEDRLLDVATGTGQLALEALGGCRDAQVVGVDISAEMMAIGKRRPLGQHMSWVQADALHLPFEDSSFSVVTHGYLLRNVASIPSALEEQYRVLNPGGKLVILESSPAPKSPLRPFIKAYLNYGVPFLGGLLAQNRRDYAYLTRSTQDFRTPAELVELVEEAGFIDVRYKSFMFGTICVHWARKPPTGEEKGEKKGATTRTGLH